MRILFPAWSGAALLLSLGCCAGPAKEVITPEEKARLEAPFAAGLRFMASVVELEVSRNYMGELSLPAGGGLYSTARRKPEEHSWVYRTRRDAPTFRPLQFGFRELSGLVTGSLTVRCPPIDRFHLALRARGAVTLVVPGGKRKGQELVIAGGRVLLDGEPVPYAGGGSGGQG
jgi:hypothetical protein